MSGLLLGSLATTEPLLETFSDASLLAAMVRFEVALARAEAACGMIPQSAADRIAAVASGAHFDARALAVAARTSATAVPAFVAALVDQVRQHAGDAADYIHRGATSQDVSDTALVLCARQALQVVTADHSRLMTSLRQLSETHAGTVMLGRTLLQPALPITFGLKVARWLAGAERAWRQLRTAADGALVLQFGGAAGTLAALGADGPRVADGLARELELVNPGAPWHTERDRLAALVASCGVYTAALGKIARDVTLLMQSEVAEVSEAGGGSSTLPHKRNPSQSAIVLAAATSMPALVAAFLAGAVNEHERGVGGWHAEGPTLAATIEVTGAAVQAMANSVVSLRVDRERMGANVAATRGAIFAEGAMMRLVPLLGRDHAQRVVAEALKRSASRDTTFAKALAADPAVASLLSSSDLAALENPDSYLGAAEAFRRILLDPARQ